MRKKVIKETEIIYCDLCKKETINPHKAIVSTGKILNYGINKDNPGLDNREWCDDCVEAFQPIWSSFFYSRYKVKID